MPLNLSLKLRPAMEALLNKLVKLQSLLIDSLRNFKQLLMKNNLLDSLRLVMELETKI